MGFTDFFRSGSQRQTSAETAAERVHAPYAIIYRSEIDYISRCIMDYPRIETGGQLFGLWTNAGVPVVLYAVGPGRNANHQETFFNQDLDYLVPLGEEIIRRYGIQHIGEWHSHHRLGLAKPSGHDAHNISSNMVASQNRHFLLCIGNCDDRTSTLNAFTFHECDPSRYVHAPWDIKPMESPYRRIIDRELGHMLVHPYTQSPSHGKLYTIESTSATPLYNDEYWLNNKRNNLVLKQIYDFVTATGIVADKNIRIDAQNIVHIKVNRMFHIEHIVFPLHFPTEPPVIEHIDSTTGEVTPQRGVWVFEGDIFEAFKRYYNGETAEVATAAEAPAAEEPATEVAESTETKECTEVCTEVATEPAKEPDAEDKAPDAESPAPEPKEEL